MDWAGQSERSSRPPGDVHHFLRDICTRDGVPALSRVQHHAAFSTRHIENVMSIWNEHHGAVDEPHLRNQFDWLHSFSARTHTPRAGVCGSFIHVFVASSPTWISSEVTLLPRLRLGSRKGNEGI